MTLWKPETVYVDEGSLDLPLTRRILAGLDGVPVVEIRDAEEIVSKGRWISDPISAGKKELFLTRRKGPFVKPCPCTPGHVRCGYFIINLDLNCPLDCSYCILQGYLDHPLVTVHVNRDDLWPELDRILLSWKAGVLRIGTGELADSLALDHLTNASCELIDYFRDKPGVMFELKTKTVNIENILESEPAPNVVVSWSLNSDEMAVREERGAPRVEERIGAAARVSRRGFPVGFHFDPLILYDGWEDGYRETVRRLLEAVPAETIAWISLGSLRFNPELKTVIRARFPESRILGGEFIRGMDGKFRYFRPDRLRLFTEMVNWILGFGGSDIPLYLCMESNDVWGRVFKKNNGERKIARSSFPRPVLQRNHSCLWG